MNLIIAPLTDMEEKDCYNFQTSAIKNYPNLIHRIAEVKTVIEQRYLPEWEPRFSKGSVSFRRISKFEEGTGSPFKSVLRRDAQDEVRLLIDGEHKLAEHFNVPARPGQIVIGIDITGRSPGERLFVREGLRRQFSANYAHPERANLNGRHRKFSVMPNYDRYLEAIFLSVTPCDLPLNEVDLQRNIQLLQDGFENE